MTLARSRYWKLYLPIVRHVRVTKADAAWFAERGVGRLELAAALAVLRRVRRDVLPLRQRLATRWAGLHKPAGVVSLLVHDRMAGVPAPRNDRRAYLDVTVDLYARTIPSHAHTKQFRFVRPAPDVVDTNLAALSKWYLDLVESCDPKASDAEVLKIVGQHTHYLANMTQMVVR